MDRIEIINTGSELLLGGVLNTHQRWLCRELSGRGYFVQRQTTIGDAAPAIQQSLAEALTRADLVIVTGGLGPTSDDLTRQAIAELAGKKLVMRQDLHEEIERFFLSRGKTIPAGVEVQALVPEGALVFPNGNGTAPGLAVSIPRGAASRAAWVIILPGPPRELYPMFLGQAVPLIEREFPRVTPFRELTLRTTGLGESMIEDRIKGLLQPLVERGLTVGYCARVGEVEVRFVATGSQADELVEGAAEEARRALRGFVFAEGDRSLEEVVVGMLIESGQTLALAESCTGGSIAHRITNVPGASGAFRGGVVAYSNEAKETFLGVRPETIERDGAVSESVAREMAEACRERFGATYGLAVTGIAGPGGGSEPKPVGTVFIGLAGSGQTKVVRQLNRYDRETFKFVTSQQALDLLRRELVRRS